MFEEFAGNAAVTSTLRQMAASGRVPQTILLSGPEGIGKATLARRFAQQLIGDRSKIERDDLNLPDNQAVIADREKWPADKRADDPLIFGSHSDFLTFPPDGPLRQISIQQMRLLKDRARFGPLKGSFRVFLIDGIDSANEQAANSLLKTLEEPPPYLVIIATARNVYDLLPTIRSRAVMLSLSPLPDEEMYTFVQARGVGDVERRIALANGSPGAALSIDLGAYDKRRAPMMKLLQTAAGAGSWGDWAGASESLVSRGEKLDAYIPVLYGLLGDALRLQHGHTHIRNIDVRAELAALAGGVSFDWIRRGIALVDEMAEMLRRNIQKSIALDALVLEMKDT